jgi:hypothetical protein
MCTLSSPILYAIENCKNIRNGFWKKGIKTRNNTTVRDDLSDYAKGVFTKATYKDHCLEHFSIFPIISVMYFP